MGPFRACHVRNFQRRMPEERELGLHAGFTAPDRGRNTGFFAGSPPEDQSSCLRVVYRHPPQPSGKSPDPGMRYHRQSGNFEHYRPGQAPFRKRDFSDASGPERTVTGDFRLALGPDTFQRRDQECGIPANREIAGLSGEDLKLAAKTAKCFPVHLTEALGMDSAQVTAGGIVTEEFYSNTLESKLVPGLYACGEVILTSGFFRASTERRAI